MKNKKTNTTLCFVAAALFFVSAILSLFTSSSISSAIVWLCLGSAFLCFGSAQKKKEKAEETTDETKADEAEAESESESETK